MKSEFIRWINYKSSKTELLTMVILFILISRHDESSPTPKVVRFGGSFLFNLGVPFFSFFCEGTVSAGFTV